MKHDPSPTIALELIQLISGIKAIHQNSEKRDCRVQASIVKIFLPRWSSKSHSQTLCGCRNESRSDWEQEIQEIWCLKGSIYSNCSRMLNIVEEHLNLYANFGVPIQSSFNPRSTDLMKHIGWESLQLSQAVGSSIDRRDEATSRAL